MEKEKLDFVSINTSNETTPEQKLIEDIKGRINSDPEGQKKLTYWANRLYLMSGGNWFTIEGLSNKNKIDKDMMGGVLLNLIAFNHAVGKIEDGENKFLITSKKENIKKFLEEEIKSLKERLEFLESRLDSLED